MAQATAELEAYEREQALQDEVDNLEALKDQALAAIDEQIDGWEKYKEEWSSVVDNYQEEQDRLIAEQVLGIELEGQNWKTRLDNLAEYVKQYNALMAQLSGAQAELDAGYQGQSAVPGMYYTGETGVSGALREVGQPSDYASMDDYYAAREKVYDKYYGGTWAQLPNAFGGVEDITIVDGKTQETGLPVGTVVHTQGGSYQITGGTGTDSDPYESVPVSDKYASGTLSASGGLSLVGENGPELRVLNNGDGVLPADVTSNLWDWGKLSPKNLLNNLGNNIMNIVIENLNLPGISNGEGFVKYLQSNAWRQAAQYASKR